MARKTKLIKHFEEKGYKYVVRLSSTGEVGATKAVMKKDGTFKDNARFDMFTLEDGDIYPYDNNVFVKLA